MIVTFHKGVFVADVLDQPGALKKAGFQLHEPTMCRFKVEECKACRAGVGRRWWTSHIEAATRMRPFCNQKALSVMREHLVMLSRSRATDADIDVPSPSGLSYLPYQRGGIAYAIQRKDTLIADEMGLGKSIEALGFINKIQPKSVIIVCPSTLIFNWRNEAEKWLVEGRWKILEVDAKSVVVSEDDDLFVIVNYEKLTGDSPLSRSLARRQFDVMVVDEAQYIKNPESARSQAVIGQEGLMRRARRCLFLTGTPIENYPKEIWPIASAICPAKFGDWWEFARRYCGLHQEERRGKKVWVSDGSSNLGELQQRLRASFMVRRLKKDVLPELPPKRRQLVVLHDAKKDWSKDPRFKRWRELYEKEVDAALAKLEASTSSDEYKAAALAMDEITGIAFEEMSTVRHEVALAKLPLAKKYLDQVLESVENVIIFAHHKDVIEELAKHFGDRAVVVHGGTPMKGPRSREVAVRDFQAGLKKIFIGQTRAAGVGLTLTAGSTVVFVEVDWVPGVVSQCEDRACRIGQKKMVHVIHLVLGGTMEVNMVQKMIRKQEVIDKALDRTLEVNLKKTA